MPSSRAREDDECTIFGDSETLTIPPSPETIRVQRLLTLTLVLATIALALALPLYGVSTLWVGPSTVFLTYVYGITVLVKINQQKKIKPTNWPRRGEGEQTEEDTCGDERSDRRLCMDPHSILARCMRNRTLDSCRCLTGERW
ncbi:hypothetical protein NMY22_g14203 [Coprinellus aureogranulatus]|nr:hypothetical protein NMY22_g14203 [Coprinellus aureogranulatus]